MEADLNELARRNYQILSIERLVSILKGEESVALISNKKLVCITFDDGKRWDFYDDYRKDGSKIKSFRTLLNESLETVPMYLSGTRALSFVIASPEARHDMCIMANDPLDVLTDDWWKKSSIEGVIGIANHSWDHLHSALENVRQKDNKKGSFFDIETYADAKGQIIDAQHVIDEIIDNRSIPAFGYPYGHVSTYLKKEFFPQYGNKMGIHGAFNTAGEPVTQDCCIWDIPRYVCGYHWRSPEAFSELLGSLEK
jgi:peptidoglycan/xylan/chitin deacetylase (PgdA/CDA1 family)